MSKRGIMIEGADDYGEANKQHQPRQQANQNLSDSYIRSLVSNINLDGFVDVQNLGIICTKFGGHGESSTAKTTHHHQQQQKQHHRVKQVRRRVHTSRPYQERLLNMAEARREIVTALKFHRAAMKQAAEKQHLHQSPVSENQDRYQDRWAKGMANPPGINPFSDYNSLQSLANTQFPNNFPNHEILTNLPDQTLGLNPNFHDFSTNVDRLHNQQNISSHNNPSTDQSTSPDNSDLTNGEAAPENGSDPSPRGGGEGRKLLHAAMDEEEMAEIRSVGEKYQMEWDDALNLATSAWWLKLYTRTGLHQCEDNEGDDDDYGCFRTLLHECTGIDPCLPHQQHLADDCYQPSSLNCWDPISNEEIIRQRNDEVNLEDGN